VPPYWLPNMHTESQTRRACPACWRKTNPVADGTVPSHLLAVSQRVVAGRNRRSLKENNYSLLVQGGWPWSGRWIRPRLISCAEAGNMISGQAGVGAGQRD